MPSNLEYVEQSIQSLLTEQEKHDLCRKLFAILYEQEKGILVEFTQMALSMDDDKETELIRDANSLAYGLAYYWKPGSARSTINHLRTLAYWMKDTGIGNDVQKEISQYEQENKQ